METVIEIMKWVGIVLAAGFIGYFGRYLAMTMIERMHKGKPEETAATEPPKEVAASQETRIEETRLKLEKKKAKAEAKRLKKVGKE
ncbi:hypothetical protein ACFLTY_02295 [Chloroflexota bacterium]